MATRGERIAAKLNRKLPQIGNSIKIREVTAGTDCPSLVNGEFDPVVDRAYHAANPMASVCVNGEIGGTVAIRTIKGLHFPSLKDAELSLKMSLGELPNNATIFIASPNQKVQKMQAFEFPRNSNQWWEIAEGFPRSISLNDVVTFFLAAGTKGKAP